MATIDLEELFKAGPPPAPAPVDLGTREVAVGQPFDINTIVKGTDAAGNPITVGSGITAEYKDAAGQPVPHITTEKETIFHVKLTTYNAGGQAVVASLIVAVKDAKK
jgi:hypothetical protein